MAPNSLLLVSSAEGSRDAHESGSDSGSDSDTCCYSLRDLLWVAMWIAAGLVEGFVVVKCLVPYPKVLADQFVFRNFIVLKMFLSAVGSSMLAQSAMSYCAQERFAASRTRGKKRYGFSRVALGTSLIGVGMAVSGSGPTMVAPAIGGLVETSWYLVIGGLVAAALVSLTDKFMVVSAKAQTDVEGLNLQGLNLEEMFGQSYTFVAMGMGALLLSAAIILEVVINFKADASKYGGVLAQEYPASILNYPAWPPTLAGLVIGLGQVPVRMVSNNGMGGSTSFVVAVSTLSCGLLSPDASLLKSLSNAPQFSYNMVFVLAGAFLASVLNSDWALNETSPPLTKGFSPMMMATGAFLTIVGSRIAGGCTCGHGVTGTSELAVESFVGAGAIFGAAIATRCIMVFALGVDE